jgi:DNA modification methylase
MPAQDNHSSADEYDLEQEARALGLLLPTEPRPCQDIGEVDAANWKAYGDILTDSLWIFGSRSRKGAHDGKYHGNFIPQIPYQAIRRFTRPGDVVLDPFLGSGTTLIECRRQGRHGIGIELVTETAQEATKRIQREKNPHKTWQHVVVGDSTSKESISQVRGLLEERDRTQVQLLIMHPPYHNIIQFSDHPQDLSNAPDLPTFLAAFEKVVGTTYELLEDGHFLVVVIGDKYGDGEWVPLGFHTMEVVRSFNYTLKSIVVKNIEGNRAKRNLKHLWRQRAFRGRFYIFKHEYIFFFQKHTARL